MGLYATNNVAASEAAAKAEQEAFAQAAREGCHSA